MKDKSPIPNSGGEAVEKTGVKNSGYIVKKGTPSGNGAKFNKLPPGQDIDDQQVCDIRAEELKNYSGGLSYPGDGWT